MVPSYLCIIGDPQLGVPRFEARPGKTPGQRGSRLSPSGSGRMTMMKREEPLTLLVKPLMPDFYGVAC